MSPLLLEGRRVLVTGGSRGIGAAIASELLRAGAKVTLVARDETVLIARCRQLAEEFPGAVFSIAADITQPTAAKAVVERSIDMMSGLDGLVNNAGSNSPTKAFLDLSREEFERVVALNFTAHVDLAREALRHFLKASHGQPGDILNIASMAGKMGVPMWSPYCSAKHAMLGFTKTIAREYAHEGVRCNAICPGFVETDMMSTESLDAWAESLGMERRQLVKEVIYRTTPQGRFVEARSVAQMALFLLSDAARDITGQAINVSCGLGDY